VFWNFGLDDKLDRDFTQFESMNCCHDETVATSTELITKVVPLHELGSKKVPARETTGIC